MRIIVFHLKFFKTHPNQSESYIFSTFAQIQSKSLFLFHFLKNLWLFTLLWLSCLRVSSCEFVWVRVLPSGVFVWVRVSSCEFVWCLWALRIALLDGKFSIGTKISENIRFALNSNDLHNFQSVFIDFVSNSKRSDRFTSISSNSIRIWSKQIDLDLFQWISDHLTSTRDVSQ